jgi:SAM-dependent methyltransferase
MKYLLRRYEAQFGGLKLDRALDHGCGVGRLTLPLSKQFAEVVALDVSTAMLTEAKANAERFGIANVRFGPADDILSNAPGTFDFVNSHMVLQHIPVRRGLPLLYRLIDKVRPGGGFHLHLSYRVDPLGWRALYWASANVPGIKLWQNVCAGRRWNAPAMQMNDYPLASILAGLSERGIQNLIVSTEHHQRFVTCSLIGTTPANSR